MLVRLSGCLNNIKGKIRPTINIIIIMFIMPGTERFRTLSYHRISAHDYRLLLHHHHHHQRRRHGNVDWQL